MTSDERDDRIIALYRSGESLRSVAREVAMSVEGVRQVLIARNEPIRTVREGSALRWKAARRIKTIPPIREIDPGCVEAIVARRAMGEDVRSIARSVGVTPDVVTRALRNAPDHIIREALT
jgi:hypothetical protein